MTGFRKHPGWPQLAAQLRTQWQIENRPCLICGNRPKDSTGTWTEYAMQDPCHAIGKSWLASNGFEAAVTDERLIFCACRDCHTRHDSWHKRLAREALPEEAWEAAKEYGDRVLLRLELEFPDLEASCPTCRNKLDEFGFCGGCGHKESHLGDAA